MRKPIWTEGLFISQHHFQVQDRYHEQLLRRRVGALRRFDWGILDLEIDERMLQAGQFQVRRLDAIWPDGLHARCGGTGEESLPEARAFEALFPEGAPSLDVFLGIPGEGVSANVATPEEPTAPRRFARTVENVPDFNTGGAYQEIEYGKPNIRVLFGSERLEGYSLIPLARLARQTTGPAMLRDNFVPPVLRLGAAPFLRAGLQRVYGAVTARQRDLAATRKQRHSGSIEFHFTDARRFWLLHTLNGIIPVLRHFVEDDRAHPEDVYLVLAELMGELCTFAADADPTSAPGFKYTELGDVFEALFARILSLLAIDSATPYVEIPLERREDGMFVGKIPESRLTNHEFFIAVRSAQKEPVVRERVPQLLKVAGWNHIYEVVKQARRGVRTEVEWNPSSSLPIKPGLVFFRVKREGPYWEEIAKTLTLAMYLPVDADWKDTWFSVYAIDPEFLR